MPSHLVESVACVVYGHLLETLLLYIPTLCIPLLLRFVTLIVALLRLHAHLTLKIKKIIKKWKLIRNCTLGMVLVKIQAFDIRHFMHQAVRVVTLIAALLGLHAHLIFGNSSEIALSL